MRAFNGGGPKARAYRDEVTTRAAAAKAAANKKRAFVVGKI